MRIILIFHSELTDAHHNNSLMAEILEREQCLSGNEPDPYVSVRTIVCSMNPVNLGPQCL